jgi:hypothetical protein
MPNPIRSRKTVSGWRVAKCRHRGTCFPYFVVSGTGTGPLPASTTGGVRDGLDVPGRPIRSP